MPFEALTSLFATSVYVGVIVRCFRARALTAPAAQFFTNSSIMYRLWADSSISWSQETRGVVTAVGRNLDGTGGVDGPRGSTETSVWRSAQAVWSAGHVGATMDVIG